MTHLRVAALYDIHGNLPALEAVLAEVEAAAPDLIVVGGDVGPGPLVDEVLDRLAAFGDRARYVMGNGDRELVSAFDGGGYGRDTPWALTAWCAERLTSEHRDALAGFEPTVSVDSVLFCHGSPRSDSEIITAVSPEERLAPMLAGVDEGIVVCGHTHHQFDRDVLGKRLLNAGSVGMPYEDEPAAYWLLLGAEPELRRTDYDIAAAAESMRASGAPDVDELMLRESLLEPVGAAWVARHFESLA
ncbi:MAG: metallophosphoesterase family protein [Solirubrobacteraceae bacterium]